MKTITTTEITNEIKRLCIEAANIIEDDVLNEIRKASKNECGLAKSILEQIIENDELAKNENIPLCQDTGITVVFVELGNQVFIDGDINEAINEGVRLGYTEGYLRKNPRFPFRKRCSVRGRCHRRFTQECACIQAVSHQAESS